MSISIKRCAIAVVLAAPALGAFAIMTRVRLGSETRTWVWLEESMRYPQIGTTPVAACPPFDENNSAQSGSE